MARFYGPIGFATMQETSPGVHRERITEHKYYGEILKNSRNLTDSGQVNDNIDISNRVSILADPYANENFHAMRYVWFMGTKWKVKSADVEPPRIILTLGGVYNGE